MHIIILAAATTLALASAARADGFADRIAQTYRAEGYTAIEIETGSRYVEVEAIRGDRRIEVLYDATTGAILRQHFRAAGHGDDIRPGIRIRHDDDRWDDDRWDDDRDDRDDRRDDDRDDRDHRDDDHDDRDGDRDDDDDDHDDRGDD